MTPVRVGDGPDDEFVRRMTLGTNCFCGALGRAGAPPGPALRCLAHGYCEAHSTPVAAQIGPEDRQRLALRIGIHKDLINQLWGGV